MNEISGELVENSKISKSTHDSLIDAIHDCAHKLQLLYNKNEKGPPPPVPPKPQKINLTITESPLSEYSSLSGSPSILDIQDSPLPINTEQDQSAEKDVYIPSVPKSELFKLYNKLIQRDLNFNPNKDLFGGFSSKEELLQKIMDYVHISATLAEIHHIRPFYLAFQLCVIDQDLFRRILPSDFFNTNQMKSSIEPSTHFFNYLCRTVEYTALNPNTAAHRAEILEYWIKTSKRLYQLRNFQSLMAITSALQSPPLYRLKGTWALVSKKKMKDLNALLEFCSEQDNYSQYRQWMKLNISKPMIPYYGIYIHDLTYIMAMGKKSDTPKKASMEILEQIRYFQSEPYYSYKYFSSLLTGNIYPKPMKPPIVSHASPPLLALNTLNEESVGLFVSHWILSQKFYSEKVIDELSLNREPRESNRHSYEKRGSLEINIDSGKLLPSLGSYRKNIMNSIKSIKSSIGRSRNHKVEKAERSSWTAFHEIPH